jgi:glycerophosphoryl diester phosphodiesterase
MTIVDNAIKYNCRRVQFWYKRFNQELIDKAHKHDIICNLFYCDVYEDAKKLYAMGIDAILSNYANITLPAARVR